MTVASESRPPVVRRPADRRRFGHAGVEFTILVAGEETGGRYSIIEYTAPPTGLGPPLHLHREMEETFHVLEGTLTFQLGHERITAPADTVVHMPAGVPHAVWNAGPTPTRFIGTFSPGGFEQYLCALLELAKSNPGNERDLRPLIAKVGEKYDQVVLGPPPGTVT
jgi:quercetin dioxygenase-like cupin family protein